MITGVHVFISGRVQGVFYRANTKNKAEQLGVNGWVKNLSDGRVEAFFQGDEKTVDSMISWCKNGPPNAEVTNVDIKKELVTETLEGFVIRY